MAEIGQTPPALILVVSRVPDSIVQLRNANVGTVLNTNHGQASPVVRRQRIDPHDGLPIRQAQLRWLRCVQ